MVQGPLRSVPLFLLAVLGLLWPLLSPGQGNPTAADGGGWLRVALQLEPPVLDPTAGAASPIAEVVHGNLFEGLISLDGLGRPGPGLAEAWEVVQGGRAVRFHLRHGVRFHDGAPFDGESVRFSLDRARGADSVNPQKAALAVIERVVVEAPDTVRIELRHPASGLLQVLGLPPLAMVSPGSAGSNRTHPVGTGPFRFAAWQRGESIRLVRNDAYWGSRASLDGVVFRFIAEPTAAYAALMAGDVDAFPNYPSPENIPQFQADPRFHVRVGSTSGETLLALNHRHPALADHRVRQALAQAVDRQALIQGAMYGFGLPIGSHFPPADPAYVDLTGLRPHDPGAARRLLAAAGFSTGPEDTAKPALELRLKLPPTPYARRVGEILVGQLAEVGVRVRTENLEWAQWIDQVFTRHDFDLTVIVHAEPFDYDIYGREDYYFGYHNPAVKALLERLDGVADPGPRGALLQDIQRVLAEDDANVFLFQYPKLGVWKAGLAGFQPGAVVDATPLSGAHWQMGSSPLAGAAAPGATAPVWLATAQALGVLVLGVILPGLALLRFGLPWCLGRLLTLLLTALGASALVFFLIQVAPGDPARYMLGINASSEAVAALTTELGLDGGLLQRYGRWLGGLLQGDMGLSYTYRVPVIELILERLAVSLPLALLALSVAILLAFPLALMAVQRPGGRLDRWVAGLSQLLVAIPDFWLGMLLTLVFSVLLHWVPAGGFPGWNSGFGAGLAALSLPALALGLPQAAILLRVLRGALLETLHEDYLRTARAKGAGPFVALWRHGLPNALGPVLTLLGMQFSFLLAGGVVIENVFFLPGVGRLLFLAIVQRDLMVIQGLVLGLVVAVVLVSFLVDALHGALDPRLHRHSNA